MDTPHCSTSAHRLPQNEAVAPKPGAARRRSGSSPPLLTAIIVGAIIAVLATIRLVAGDSPQHASPSQNAKAGMWDEFGIRQIHPTEPEGMRWTANWSGQRNFRGVDPVDRWFDADNGAASYAVADGVLAITGEFPRIFIHDPEHERQWRDVEITMYVKRVADDGVPYAGMVSVARTNHGTTGDETEDLCDSRGLGARLRYDGEIDFEKETAHPDTEVAGRKVLWDDGMPKDVWLGYKHIVYDLPNGDVRQELWLDRSNGEDGGQWVKINEITDDNNLFGERACAPGIDPQMALTNSPTRSGSESSLPNVSVYFRSDGVHENGLLYKWGSVREIRADR